MPPFPPSLKPAARSTYRAVLRASRITFKGDPPRKTALAAAVRETFSSPSLTSPQSSSSTSSSPTRPTASPPDPTEEELAKRLDEWREVAQFLRRNVVQGTSDDAGRYRLRVTRDTELGDNAEIRDPARVSTTPFPNRDKRRRGEVSG